MAGAAEIQRAWCWYMGYMGLVVAAAPQCGMGAAVKQQIVQMVTCAHAGCVFTYHIKCMAVRGVLVRSSSFLPTHGARIELVSLGYRHCCLLSPIKCYANNSFYFIPSIEAGPLDASCILFLLHRIRKRRQWYIAALFFILKA